MILESGELNTRVHFQKRVSKKNSVGETEHIWKDIGTFLVKYATLSNKSMEIAKGFSASVDFGILMRYFPQIDNDCRVIVMGKTVEISGVIHDPNKQYSQIFLSQNQT